MSKSKSLSPLGWRLNLIEEEIASFGMTIHRALNVPECMYAGWCLIEMKDSPAIDDLVTSLRDAEDSVLAWAAEDGTVIVAVYSAPSHGSPSIDLNPFLRRLLVSDQYAGCERIKELFYSPHLWSPQLAFLNVERIKTTFRQAKEQQDTLYKQLGLGMNDSDGT